MSEFNLTSSRAREPVQKEYFRHQLHEYSALRADSVPLWILNFLTWRDLFLSCKFYHKDNNWKEKVCALWKWLNAKPLPLRRKGKQSVLTFASQRENSNYISDFNINIILNLDLRWMILRKRKTMLSVDFCFKGKTQIRLRFRMKCKINFSPKYKFEFNFGFKSKLWWIWRESIVLTVYFWQGELQREENAHSSQAKRGPY